MATIKSRVDKLDKQKPMAKAVLVVEPGQNREQALKERGLTEKDVSLTINEVVVDENGNVVDAW